MTVRALRVPRGFVIAQHLQFRILSSDVNQHQVVHIVADEHRVVGIRVIVIAIERHINSLDDSAESVGQSDERNHRVLIDLDIRRDGLRVIRRNRAIVPRSAIIEKEITVLRPKLVTNRILFILAKARTRFA